MGAWLPPRGDADLLFDGLRVLDVGTWIAGPVSATILADLGADVIKVEQPSIGDPYRRLPLGPLSPKSDLNYTWLADARNKRGITLNLATDEGREILLALVRECDVYVTNQPPPTRRKLRLAYTDLAPLNDRMIYASLTAYGETGPEADVEGFDGVAYWGRSGLMDLVRARGAAPGASVPGQGDHPTAVSLYAAIVTALLRRERTGQGSHVHTSLLANGAWSNGCYVQASLVGADFSARRGEAPRPSPNRVIYETADGGLLQLYMLRTDDELVRLMVAAGLENELADPRFAGPEERQASAPALVDLLAAAFRSRPAAEWLAITRAEELPVSLVARVEDLPGDEQMLAANVFVPPADDRVGAPLVLNHPVNVDRLGRVGPRAAPALGEHTREVLSGLGLDDDAIEQLARRGVV